MNPVTIPTTPFHGQRLGTLGLHKRVAVFQQPHYLENLVHALFDVLSPAEHQTLVVDRDGRYCHENCVAIHKSVRVGAAKGHARVLVGRAGILFTPAVSAVISRRRARRSIVLLDSHKHAGIVTLCGEEGHRSGSSHTREKDVLGAVLLWLNLLVVSGKSVEALVRELWREHGRCVYSPHDGEGIASNRADSLMGGLRAQLWSLPGQFVLAQRITAADDFAYTDLVDGSLSVGRHVRLMLRNGSCVVFQLSSTGNLRCHPAGLSGAP